MLLSTNKIPIHIDALTIPLSNMEIRNTDQTKAKKKKKNKTISPQLASSVSLPATVSQEIRSFLSYFDQEPASPCVRVIICSAKTPATMNHLPGPIVGRRKENRNRMEVEPNVSQVNKCRSYYLRTHCLRMSGLGCDFRLVGWTYVTLWGFYTLIFSYTC